jgi:hypothetical protein
MRFASILIASLLIGCSSDDTPADSGPKVNACTAAGGTCAANFPFKCAPGYEAAMDPARATACGKSIGDNPVDVSCCFPAPPEDTGTTDTGSPDADAATDATDASDATDATDASDATDSSLLDTSVLDVALDG